MASFGSGGSGSGSSWRSGPLGTSGGSGEGIQSKMSPIGSSSVGANAAHQSHKRERDRDKNHETVCNLLSMLTIGVEESSSSPHPNYGQEGASSSSSSANKGHNYSSGSSVDNQRMLLVNMANTPESCLALRRAGCIPLLVGLIHPPQRSEGMQPPPEIIRVRAARALKNIVQFNPDEKVKKKELRVLKILEGIRLFSEAVKGLLKKQKINELDSSQDPARSQQQSVDAQTVETLQHPSSSITTLMKLSFDEEHRHTMCLLGAIHALADLVVSDHLIHGNGAPHLKEDCLLLRRYSGMTLTNLTFNDGTNKALLCGMKEFLSCLVNQLDCDNEEICQVTASVLRNLSWHADSASRACLRESSAVSKLILAAIKAQKEATLKANLSALWNLSAHSPTNMSAICSASDESLPFLISLMRPNSPIVKQMKTPMTIIENAGGILRNISSHLSTSPELRKILRENHGYEILLEHLKSSSLIVVSNACGTLWSLSGGTECDEDQRKLLDLNAVPMLKSLVYSKHERISQGASAALRNLLSSRFAKDHTLHLDSRLTAQIYSSRPGDRDYANQNHLENELKSPVSDSEFEMGLVSNNFGHHSQSQQFVQHCTGIGIVQQDPPAAHQQSSAGLLQFRGDRQGFSSPQPNSHKPLPINFHNHPPLSLPFNPSSSGFRRPQTINYYNDSEPLDLTMTSAKSSPIHVISAAEFGLVGNPPMHKNNQHQRCGAPSNMTTGFYHPHSYSQNQMNYPFFNQPNMVPQLSDSGNGNTASIRTFGYPGAKFNQSCPEILSRFQQNLTPAHQNHESTSISTMPLDYSSTTASASSSTRGAGEAATAKSSNSALSGHSGGGGMLNDSNGGGDTTFNYSLRFGDDDGDHHQVGSNAKSEDTVKTYCYEGTPHNFSISNSCQDLVHLQDLEDEKEAGNSTSNRNPDPESKNSSNSTQNGKLQPIDEVPKPYYVENTPAEFSRTSSLSSINSSDGLMNAGENRADSIQDFEHSGGNGQDESQAVGKPSPLQRPHMSIQIPPQPLPRKKHNMPHTPSRVTFSAEETPLMFSRSSSVASLDSLDVGGGTAANIKNEDDLSDYSRRASEVVSPFSDLPDSPRALAPPVRVYEQNQHKSDPRMKTELKKGVEEDAVKIFSISEEKSGLNSCRSLSPLTVDGEELPIIGKDKLDSNNSKEGTTTDATSATCPTAVDNRMDRISAVGSNIVTSELANMKMSAPQEPGMISNRQNIKRATYDDEMKVFAMEGTPFYGVSNATSLSDLMADIEETPETNLSKIQQISQPMENEPKAVEKMDPSNSGKSETKDEPIYSDAQLLEKCIKVGKAMGIPKSQSEFRISPKISNKSENGQTTNGMDGKSNREGNENLGKQESKSQDFEFDDPDLAALIQIGRNRANKEKSSSGKGKSSRKGEKVNFKQNFQPQPTQPSKTGEELSQSAPADAKLTSSTSTTTTPGSKAEQNITPKEADVDIVDSKEQDEVPPSSTVENPSLTISLSLNTQPDPNQVSTMSLGSEWNDETPTFSSPIPSMSISTAFKMAGSVGGDSSVSVSRPPQHPQKPSQDKDKANTNTNPNTNMNTSCISLSLQHELLDNIDPPSTFSNLVSSTDCILGQSPQLQPRSQNSTLSDRLNKKWKALKDAADNGSTHSNLTGQKPPLDFDLENSMISVASIKSEIYELSSASGHDIFESAVEEFGTGTNEKERKPGDMSLGGNTYTIFPPENANRLSGVKSTDLSDGGNTVVSEDFTDAEDIEEFETAADDVVEVEVEKTDMEKVIVADAEVEVEADGPVQPLLPTPTPKPLMEVHPLVDSDHAESNKYKTFVVKKSPMSPRSSPRQKRREDPERYRTRTINPVNMGKAFMSDANGNPELKFATFRVGGPKIIKPSGAANAVGINASNLNYIDSDSTNSPGSTPGHSPKGIRGRRKPLYSSLPPSAIIRKKSGSGTGSGPPPVPPKPMRAGSPARSTTSTTSSVYVRPTRTTELRIAANANANASSSRDNSPRRGIGGDTTSSRNSSNSSLNLIHSSRFSDTGIPITSTRPKVAPKPPVRTTASINTPSSTCSTPTPKGFTGSAPSMHQHQHHQIQIKPSNSSFAFGQHAKIGDSGSVSSGGVGVTTIQMKGYSTLPKSSKLGISGGGSDMPFSVERYSGGESRESIAGSEKSSKSGIGKITYLWRKMDFRGNKEKDSATQGQGTTTGHKISHNVPSDFPTKDAKDSKHEKRSASSRLSNLFHRPKKDKDQKDRDFKDKGLPPIPPQTSSCGSRPSQNCQKPFRDPLPIRPDSATPNFAPDCAPASTGGLWMRRDGENKVLVPPFNYTPPNGQRSTLNSTANPSNSNPSQDKIGSSNPTTTEGSLEANSANTATARSSKITTV